MKSTKCFSPLLTAEVSGRQDAFTAIYLGEGNDQYIVGNGLLYGFSFGESGDDLFDIQQAISGSYNLYAGSGSDTVNAGSIAGLVDLGSGNPMPSEYLATYNNSTLSLGNDNNVDLASDINTVNVTGSISGGTILGGAGIDKIYVTNGYVDSGATINLGANNDSLTAMGLNNSSTVDMGDGDDVVTIKTDIGNGTGTPTLGLGSGNDTLTVGNSASNDGRLLSGNIDMGTGYDKAYINGTISGGTLNMGSGGSIVQIRTLTGGSVTSTDGVDDIKVTGAMSGGSISTGNDNDKVIIEGIMKGDSSINTGSGNDTVEVTQSVEKSGIYSPSLDLGTGDDSFKSSQFKSGTLSMGDGIDIVDITDTSSGMSGGTIDLGAGNDTINLANMTGGTINGGVGNDNINIVKYTGGTINGGDGIDTVHITGSGSSLTTSSISAVEVLDLGTGDMGNTFSASFNQIRTSSLSGLFIAGDAKDTVNLSGAGNWTKSSTITTGDDGNTYYAYTGKYLSYSDQVIYIDTDIAAADKVIL
uniref:Uncharacterized protein n=1 Tax=Psychrobacter sp. (strain PRwf-1) TaxID=349106 RepID=A5WEB3_PSYWF